MKQMSAKTALKIASFMGYLMGYLKGKSSLMVFDRYANLKYVMGTVSFGVEDISWIQ